MPNRLLPTAAAMLLLVACGDVSSPPAGDGAATPAGSWVLDDATPAIDVGPDARVTMEVEAEGGGWQVGGTAACNSYFGTVATDGSTWRGEGYSRAEMGCEEPRMSIEDAYLDALVAVDTWARPSSDELVLTGPGVELRFEALPPVPTADLTATTWVLDGLVAGAGPEGSVSSTAAGADEAILRLDPDGGVDASTGCRTFTGEWTQSGDEVLLTTFGVRDDSPNVADDGMPTCDDMVVEQERHVLSVLGDGFRAEVDEQRLRLTSRDGLGLTYMADDA